jgi:hypothetical protein
LLSASVHCSTCDSGIPRKLDLKEQLVCIKHCFKLGENAIKTFYMLEAGFGEQKTESTHILSGFQCSKAVQLLLKMLNAQDVQQ